MESIERQQSSVQWSAYVFYILAALFLCYEMAIQASPSVMTHELMRDFHIGAARLGALGAFYFYSYTLMQIPAGILFDRYSCRGLLSFAVVVCVAGAFFFSMANSLHLAQAGRFFMGIGSAFAFIGVLVVASDWFPRMYFALLVGVAQLLAAFGAMSGQIPLAGAVDHFGWRSTLHGIALIGVVLAVAIAVILRSKPKPAEAIAASRELSIMDSLKTFLSKGQTWWVALYAFMGWAPITAFTELWGVPYLMRAYDMTRGDASTVVGCTWIGLGLTSPFIGWLSDRIGLRCRLLWVMAVIGLVSSSLILYLPSMPLWLLYVLMLGFGMATAGQILSFAVVKDNNAKNTMATAIGFNNMAVVASGALCQPLVGWLLKLHWAGKFVDGSPVYSLENYRFALSLVPVTFLIAFVAGKFLVRETYCRDQSE